MEGKCSYKAVSNEILVSLHLCPSGGLELGPSRRLLCRMIRVIQRFKTFEHITLGRIKELYDVWVRVASHVYPIIRPHMYLLIAAVVLTVVNRTAALVLPFSTRFLVDRIVNTRDLYALRYLAMALVAASVVQGGSAYIFNRLVEDGGERIVCDLRSKVLAHVIRLPMTFYDANSTGQLMSRIMSDVQDIRALIGTAFVACVADLSTAIIAAAVLLQISASMTAVIILAIMIYTIAIRRVFAFLRPLMLQYSQLNAQVSGRLSEALGGIRVIKAYHAEARETTVFEKGVRGILESVLVILKGNSLMFLVGTLLAGVASAALICLGVLKVFAGSLTLGQLVTFTVFSTILVAPLNTLAGLGRQFTQAIAGVDRTREILNFRRETECPARTTVLPRTKGHITFDHVGFSYRTGEPVLQDVCFEVEAGTCAALVGHSGSGKSTIIQLVAAFYSPTEGTIFVDGIDLNHVRLDSYRTQLGVVLQETFLFDGTIYENVAFARPAASKQQVLEACHIAHVDEFAEKCKQGYQTLVGERGVRLSGGQQQRVSIARAILADPAILILDEATSSLDSVSEAFIQRGLETLMNNRTTIVIAHRLSTIQRAEQILVLKQGRITERGTHETLKSAGAEYHSLYTKQLILSAEERVQ